MLNLFNRYVRNDEGGTMIEYALIGAILAIAVLSAVQVISAEVNTSFSNTANSIAIGNAGAP